MDSLSNYLLGERHSHHAKLSPESLELMGKSAANMFLNEGVRLNEGIAKLAGEHADISHEQVKRVCEFANTAVYLAKHDQNKTAGMSSSYPQYELADPARVIQDLADGARPTVVTRTDVDYGRPPEKVFRHSPETEKALHDLFRTSSSQEDLSFSKESAVSEVIDAKHSLVALKENLESVGERCDLMHKEASAVYYDLVKRHLLDGGDFVDVVVAARSSGVKEAMANEILSPVVEGLLLEKVASHKILKQSVRTLSKFAHRVVNEQHPLVTTFREIASLEIEIEKIAVGILDVDQQLKKVNDFIRVTFDANKTS